MARKLRKLQRGMALRLLVMVRRKKKVLRVMDNRFLVMENN
jgi:hypothetical protein